MKKLILITGCVLMLSLVINAGILPVMAENRMQRNVSETVSVNEKHYIIREYNGKIAVFKCGEDIPFKTTDMMVSLLPEYDKQLLKTGIEAGDISQLNSILEDYLS